jgi:hypothetical protein
MMTIWQIIKGLMGRVEWLTCDGHEKRETKCPICGEIMTEKSSMTQELWCPVHGRIYQIWPDGHASVGLERYGKGGR